MRTLIAASMAVVFTAVLAAPAMADCSADMAKAEPQIMKVSDATKKAQAVKELGEAKDAMKKKNEKQCMDFLSSAKKTAGIK
jgi:hypothetical protein